MELQKRVDRYLADWGGTQTAENEISEPGADLILAPPGETVARDLSQPSSAATTCREGHFCAWKIDNFAGSDFVDMYYCGRDYRIPWRVSTGSWMNNQTNFQQAKMKSDARSVICTTPPAFSADSCGDWRPVAYGRPC